MKYEIKASKEFDKWLKGLSVQYTNRVLSRLYRIEQGNFGDHKQINDRLYELRIFFGKGYRIYYAIDDETIILLLNAGDKSKQSRDINKAQIILNRRQ